MRGFLRAAGDSEDRGFGWIDSFRILRRDLADGRRVMQAIEVTLNDWMFRAIVQERRVLTIDAGYFGLTMGLERRLYELARKHLGQQAEWTIALPRLAEKCGTDRDIRKVKADMKRIIERDSLLGYRMILIEPPNELRRGRIERIMVTFSHRRDTIELAPTL
jgi:plasmid replication initiation protein